MPRSRRIMAADSDRPLYMISVAADLAGVHPQTLRIYERKLLVQPRRSSGNTRLYSDADIERLRLIQQLTQEEGINLAGVERIIELTDAQERLHDEIRQLRGLVDGIRRRVAEQEAARATVVRTELVLVPRGVLQRRRG
jgi:MerR family transcriptional regulator/heat shock protein HspR